MKRQPSIHIPDASLRTNYQQFNRQQAERKRTARIIALIVAVALSVIFLLWITVSDASGQASTTSPLPVPTQVEPIAEPTIEPTVPVVIGEPWTVELEPRQWIPLAPNRSVTR